MKVNNFIVKTRDRIRELELEIEDYQDDMFFELEKPNPSEHIQSVIQYEIDTRLEEIRQLENQLW